MKPISASRGTWEEDIVRNIPKPRFAVLLSLLLIVPLCLSAKDKRQKPPEPVSTLNFVVLKDSDGTPIKNASVVIHSLNKDAARRGKAFNSRPTAMAEPSSTASLTASYACKSLHTGCKPTAMTLK
jgi:hypothetical protein